MPGTLKAPEVPATWSRPSTARSAARIRATPPILAPNGLISAPSAPEVPPMAVR